MDREKPAAIDIGYFDHLVIHIADGNLSYLAELYAVLRKPIFVFALSVLHDYYEAEDVMQETFLKITTHASSYRRGTNARAWIFAIARNLCLNLLKARSNEVLTEDMRDAQTTGFEDQVASTYDFMRMIRPLDETERQIIVLNFYGGLSKKQIARIMDLSPENVRAKYSRAIKKLKKVGFS